MLRFIGGPKHGEKYPHDVHALIIEVPELVLPPDSHMDGDGTVVTNWLNEDTVLARWHKLSPKMGFGDDAWVLRDYPEPKYVIHQYRVHHNHGTAVYVGAF